MRWHCICVLLILLAGVCPAAMAVKKVSVEQLEKLIADNRDKSDHALANNLYDVELTEQLNDMRLHADAAALPGDESRAALTVIADIAMFLPLPDADLVGDARPDIVTVKAIYKSGIDYAAKLIPKLPNFFATRTINRYSNTPPHSVWTVADAAHYQALHPAGSSTVTVYYRHGHEAIDNASANRRGNDVNTRHLSTQGEFGPILQVILVDSSHGFVGFSHWEKLAGVKTAVFDYTVPKQFSHYAVSVPVMNDMEKESPAYHGEIAIDPANGRILRMTVLADVEPDDAVVTANMLVDYGEVEIGGKKYMCPVKSVAYSQEQLVIYTGYNPQGNVNKHAGWETFKQRQTNVNDIRFSEYHQFRVDVEIVGAEDTPK